jgi:acyl-coenzyme A synthetase/AMP-(fatty) acid ligase
LQYVLPSLHATPLHLELKDLDLPSTSRELFTPTEVEPVDYALVTFTTGSTGLPKLLLWKHAFLLNQTHSLSMAYDTAIKEKLEMEEEDAVYCTNLPVFPLHFLKVRGEVR